MEVDETTPGVQSSNETDGRKCAKLKNSKKHVFEAQGPVWNQKKRNVHETLAISQEDR